MNDTQFALTLDHALFNELYGGQPQAITWMSPVWNDEGNTITDFEYVYSNAEGLRYLNLTPEQHQGLRISTSPTLNDRLRKAVLEEITRVYQTGEDSRTDVYNPVLDKYARVLRTKVRNGVLTVIQERTEENRMIRQLELQTRELEEKKRQIEQQGALLDNMMKHSSNGISVGKAVRDSAGTIVDFSTALANDAACRFTGLSKEDYLSKRGGELDPNFPGSPYFVLCVQCMETGEPFISQYFFASINRWLEVSVSRMDEEHLIHIFTDITPIKEAQLLTERSAVQLQTIINRTQSGVLSATPVWNDLGEIVDFRFVLANKALASYVQQAPEAMVGELGSKWFPAYRTNGLFTLFCDTYLSNRVNRFDFHYNADGIDAWIDMQCTRFDEAVLVTFTDYTPVKKLQLELQKTVEELRQSNKSLEEFAYAASHDLQEPLRKIQTFSDRLRRELAAQLSGDQQLLFERLLSASRRMRQLIDDLLAYAQASRKESEPKDVDLNRVVEVVLQDLEASIHETGALVSVQNLPLVRGDERQLHQLFQNLLSNALKYRKPDLAPQVTLSCSLVQRTDIRTTAVSEPAGTDYYQIEVADNGIGFEPEYVKSIFELFHRLHGRAEYEGTGIGLAIVHRVVQNHGGHIEAVGRPSEGATFRVFLPAE